MAQELLWGQQNLGKPSARITPAKEWTASLNLFWVPAHIASESSQRNGESTLETQPLFVNLSFVAPRSDFLTTQRARTKDV